MISPNFETHPVWVELHVSANPCEKVLNAGLRIVVRIREVFDDWKNNLGIEHSLATKDLYKSLEASVDPAALFVGDRQFGWET